MRPKKKDGARRIIHEVKNIAWTPLQMFLTHTHAKKLPVSQKRLESVCGKKEKSVHGRSFKYSNRYRLNASSTVLAMFTRNYKTSWSETRRVDAVKQNWMCAADYTCILIRIVWTPFLLSVIHTHAIRKMVCQKRLESVCGKKQALTSRWFVVVDLRTAHVVDLRPHVGLAGWQTEAICRSVF